jgi:hypothetical protein
MRQEAILYYGVSDIEIEIFLGSREQPVREADNLTAVCEPTV